MGEERIHGPYKHGNKFRVIEVRGDGERSVVGFESEAQAYRYIEKARRIASGRSIGDAVTEYLDYLKLGTGPRGKVRRASTIKLEAWRLKAMLRLVESDRPVSALTRQVATKLLSQRQPEVKTDTLVGELAVVTRWASWCCAQGWLAVNPFTGLVAQGERSTGKPQLRVDAARKFLSFCLAEGSAEGTAAAMALLMGLRASELTSIRARDVDDGGSLLWVSVSKTKKGLRRLEIPLVLRARLLQLAAGKCPDAAIWGDVDRHWLNRHVVRLSAAAGVDRVSPHGLRGTWATLAVSAMSTEHVAAALGHEKVDVTRASYLAPGSEDSAASTRLGTLLGSQLPASPLNPEDGLN